MRKGGVGAGREPDSRTPQEGLLRSKIDQKSPKSAKNGEKSKKSRKIPQKIEKSDFSEKCTHYGGLTMFLGVPMVQKSVKISEIAKKRSKGRKNMPKNRIRKNDAKKRCKKARTGARRGRPRIPCLSLPGLAKGGRG